MMMIISEDSEDHRRFSPSPSKLSLFIPYYSLLLVYSKNQSLQINIGAFFYARGRSKAASSEFAFYYSTEVSDFAMIKVQPTFQFCF
jgi:hypothetical protein